MDRIQDFLAVYEAVVVSVDCGERDAVLLILGLEEECQKDEDNNGCDNCCHEKDAMSHVEFFHLCLKERLDDRLVILNREGNGLFKVFYLLE